MTNHLSEPLPKTDHTMRAIVQDAYGSADVLHVAQLARPEVAENEVLVRVHAAGLDRGTWHLMTGRPTCAASPSDSAGRGTRCPGSTSPAPSSRSARR